MAPSWPLILRSRIKTCRMARSHRRRRRAQSSHWLAWCSSFGLFSPRYVVWSIATCWGLFLSSLRGLENMGYGILPAKNPASTEPAMPPSFARLRGLSSRRSVALAQGGFAVFNYSWYCAQRFVSLTARYVNHACAWRMSIPVALGSQISICHSHFSWCTLFLLGINFTVFVLILR